MGLRALVARRVTDSHQDEGGAVAIMAAVLAMALLASAALAVDVGRTAYASRDQQGVTDRAALDSVSTLHQPALVGQSGEELLQSVYEAAEDSIRTRNPAAGGTAERRTIYRIDLGRMSEDQLFIAECGGYFLDQADEAPDDEEPPTACPESVTALTVDAVRVLTHGEVGYVLPLGASRSAELRKAAVAAAGIEGVISAATTTVSLEGGLIDELLGELVGGGEVSIDLVGYQGITETQIRLEELAAELGLGSVDQLLEAEITVSDLLAGTISLLEAEGETASLELAAQLASIADGLVAGALGPIVLGVGDDDVGVIDVETGSRAGSQASVDALELVMASLQLANRGNALTMETTLVGDLVEVTLTVVEPPRIAVGRPGRDANGDWRTVAETSQFELAIELPFGESTTQVDDGAVEGRVEYFRDRLDDLGSLQCSARRQLLRDIEDEVEAIEQFAEEHGILGSLVGIIDGLLSGIASLLNVCPGDGQISGVIDDYEVLLEELAEAGVGVVTTVRPELTITLGAGEVRLVAATCSDPLGVTIEAASDAAVVALPTTTLVNLGPVGAVRVKLEGYELGGVDDDRRDIDPPPPPFPTEPERFSSTEVNLVDLLGVLDYSDSTLLSLPLGETLGSLVATVMEPVLTELQGEVDEVMELLGADLGAIESQVHNIDCTSRALVE